MNLSAGFIVNQTNASQELPGEFVSRQIGSQDLAAAFDGQVSLNLLGEFVVRQPDSEDLPAGFDVNYWYHVSHLVITTGSIAAGTVDNTRADDGNDLVLAETGLPADAFDYEFHWLNVPANQVFGIRLNGWYDGNAAHIIKLYEWNFTTPGWDAVTNAADDIPDAVAEQDYVWMAGGPNYVSGGEYRLRLFHTSAGNPVHVLNVDYLWLDETYAESEDSPPAHFIARQPGSANLLSTFIVRHSGSQELGASFDGQVSLNLPAEFSARRSTQQELAAEFTVNQSSENVHGEFVSRQPGSQALPCKINIMHFLTLPSEFIVTRSTSRELACKFTIRGADDQDLPAQFETTRPDSEEFLAKFQVRVTSDVGAIVIAVDPNAWINFRLGVGTGFLDGPYLGPDHVHKVFGGASETFLSEYLKNRYDSLQFGWKKDAAFTSNMWSSDFCVEDIVFMDRIVENWDWDEQAIITAILEDTYTRLSFWVPGGHGGWNYAGTNYGTGNDLRCSKFYGYPPGTSETQIDDEEIFIKFNLGSLSESSLDRLGWARIELYRYAGAAYARSRLTARRIAACWETSVVSMYWNPGILIGGCETGTPHPWTETSVRWDITGRYNLNMGGPSHYMGLPSFTKSTPTPAWGLTAENNEWDMIRISALLEGWLDGSHKNEGLAILANGIDGGDSTHEMNTFYTTPRFYSSRAAPPNNPRLRLQYIPAASAGLWSFASPDRWQINLTNPYRGTGSLHLIDWSKVSYDESRTNTSKVTLVSDDAFSEGCIDTFFRLNNATYPRLNFSGATHNVDYTTPRGNFLNIYIRYQDASNYYLVQLRPTGQNSIIQRRLSAANVTLKTFDSGIPAGTDWNRIRVFWAVDGSGTLHICCFVYDLLQAVWTNLASAEDANNYWSAGGDIAFESYDAELDETKISERVI